MIVGRGESRYFTGPLKGAPVLVVSVRVSNQPIEHQIAHELGDRCRNE